MAVPRPEVAEAMDALPQHFDRLAKVAAERARAFQRLSPDERFQAIFDLIASGESILAQSPHRQAGIRLRQAREAEWKRIQRELFSRHGR
jgi:hypothetical protein